MALAPIRETSVVLFSSRETSAHRVFIITHRYWLRIPVRAAPRQTSI